ncbi:MAG: glycosyltransferase [Anaerolineae bacterium]|nr:glycosyltransferase [Thermoflexales bacterium]MDW8408934.1 glycosyltransferase [Anaerolineae bacterium]
MRILFLTPQVPFPPRQGTALRNWGLISGLADRHELWLLSFDEQLAPDQRRELADMPDALRRVCAEACALPAPRRSLRRRLRTLITSSLPDMAWRLWSPRFAAQFERWLRERDFDIVQIEGIELARYALESASLLASLSATAGRSRPALVFDDHNCEYLLQRRAFEADVRNPRRWHAALYSFINWRRLVQFERRMVRAARATLCVSPQDAASIRKLDPGVRPHVIFNGIEVDHYAAPDLADRLTHAASPTLLFTGKMDFRWNVDAVLWFADQVLPFVRQHIPDVRWLIVGQNPSPRLDRLRADSCITITGAVDDTRPFIRQADVYIAPLLVGSGTRFKLLEAMAMQRAIVTTSRGCEGFEVTSGDELLIADDAGSFAQAVIDLLRDPHGRAEMGRRAQAFVAARYDWRVIVPHLEGIYARLAADT